jgi:hypothetical protein
VGENKFLAGGQKFLYRKKASANTFLTHIRPVEFGKSFFFLIVTFWLNSRLTLMMACQLRGVSSNG